VTEEERKKRRRLGLLGTDNPNIQQVYPADDDPPLPYVFDDALERRKMKHLKGYYFKARAVTPPP
jgi:hypothetical protein